MRTIKKTVEVKDGRSWKVNYTETNETEIYKSLAMDIINKKIQAAAYIKRIKRTSNYDGTQNIIVTYDNDCRAVYTVASR